MAAMDGKTVVVLGGGLGGLRTATKLRGKLGREHRVVLVEREIRQTFAPSYPWLMLGWRDTAGISKDLASVRGKGVELMSAEVRGIDVANNAVETDGRQLHYDYLVVALGADLAPDAVPGFGEAAHGFYDLAGATRLRDRLRSFAGGTVAVVIASLPFKCPAAPYEGALLIDYAFRKRSIRDRADLQVYTPEPLPMPVAGPLVGSAVKQLLENRGIGFHPGYKLVSVDPDRRELVFENGEKASFDLLVGVPPHRAPAAVRESTLVGEGGWVPVDPATMCTQESHVYAIGDVTAIKLPLGMLLPKAGVFAHAQADVVADNIAAEIEGHPPARRFDGKGSCFLEVGYGKAAYADGSFYAEPRPQVRLRGPGRMWHWQKVLLEKLWLWGWF